MPDNHDMSAPEARRYLGSILLVGGLSPAVALWCWFAGSHPAIWDEHDYDALAVNLVRSGEFGFRPAIPSSIRPPLYPATVAAVYGLFGLENFQAVRLLQAGLSLLNVLLLYRFGTVVSSRRVGVWLAGLYCFYPSMLGVQQPAADRGPVHVPALCGLPRPGPVPSDGSRSSDLGWQASCWGWVR